MKQKKRKKARLAREQPARTGAERDAGGRVYLRVLRDPASGREQVALEAPVFAEAWQNEITAATANTVRGFLRDAPTLERALELVRSVMAGMSRLSDGLLARAPAGAVACRAGCDHCCHQSVGVTAAEALAIFDHLVHHAGESERARLTSRIAERYAATRGLTSAQRFSPEQPCPFLDSGKCSIYEVRPLSCRGMNSLDADECAKRLRDPETRAAFLASGSGGHSFMEPIRAFHAISAGLQLGLSELYGLDMRPLELTAALQLLLTGNASIPEQWLQREHPFEPARGGDSTGDRTIRELSGALAAQPGNGTLTPSP